jgi:hypothetical protein
MHDVRGLQEQERGTHEEQVEIVSHLPERSRGHPDDQRRAEQDEQQRDLVEAGDPSRRGRGTMVVGVGLWYRCGPAPHLVAGEVVRTHRHGEDGTGLGPAPGLMSGTV